MNVNNDDKIDIESDKYKSIFKITIYENILSCLLESVFVKQLKELKENLVLIYIKEHDELYSERIKEIFAIFISETTEDLFPTWDKANEYVLDQDVINKYIGGELGTNELLYHRVLLFNEFDDICNLMFESVEGTLKQKKLLTDSAKNYLIDLLALVD